MNMSKSTTEGAFPTERVPLNAIGGLQPTTYLGAWMQRVMPDHDAVVEVVSQAFLYGKGGSQTPKRAAVSRAVAGVLTW